MTFLGRQNCGYHNPVIAMGTFDGVHLGHQKLIRKLVETARKKDKKAVVITYVTHPLETIHRKTFPYLLTEQIKKEELLKSLGVDCVLFLNFSQEMAAMDPDDFINKIIKGELAARDIIVGYDTHFGCNRTGNYDYLQRNSNRLDIDVQLVDPYKIDNRIVSSSLIRDFVREGNMTIVEDFLGRQYSLLGSVVSGKKIGRTIGFPTINTKPVDDKKLIPEIGVYFTKVLIDGSLYESVTNIGYSPTLKNVTHREIESFLLDFDGDLYGSEVEIFFCKRLRDELYFSTKEELITRIDTDVAEAKEYFNLT